MDTERLIGKLREEIGLLREQNTQWRQMVRALGEQLTMAQEQIATLQEQLAVAEQRIEELEQTKEEPPSFVKPSKPKREGPKAPRRRRAKEHNHGRKRAEAVTHREEHRIEQCPECACKLRKERVAWRREVIDLPPPQAVEVTEHVIFKGYCPRCAAWRYAERDMPDVVGQRRFGARLMVLVGYLAEELRLPQEAIQRYLQTFHGLEVSAGAIVDLRHGLAESLQGVVDELAAQIRRSAVVHADETGWREDGQNGYVWVFSTPEGIRWYLHNHSRAQHVVEGVLGEEFRGILESDFYGAYNVYRGPHQRCWVHLLRALHTLKEKHPGEETVQAWAREMRALYDDAQSFLKSGTPSQSERERLYITLVSEAERLGLIYARMEHPCRALAKRVLRHQDELFQFVLVAGVAADNNLAERSLRPLVVVRKISGGTRSPKGSKTRMTLASVFATLKARGQNPYTGCLALLRTNSWAQI